MTTILTETESPTRHRTGFAVTVLGGLVLLCAGSAKLLGVPAVVHQLGSYGFEGEVPLVGTLELLSGALLLLPRTRSLGLLFASAFMGGAIATHVQHREVLAILPAGLVLALIWIGVWLEHPASLWSFQARDGQSPSYIWSIRRRRLQNQ